MAAMLTKTQAQNILRKVGFDNAHSNPRVALMEFQRANNIEKKALEVDGILGPKTSDALRRCYARHLKGEPTMSAHFSYIEFRCKGPATDAGCRRISMLRAHVRRLEAYRAKIGNKPVTIMSGYRCRKHNERVGGAKSSQHMFGAASDIQGLASLTEKERMQLFAGLGYKKSTGKVVHVDSRDKSGHNTTGGTPTNPTEWRYAS
jgi:zinc D-Ala-D-Ala carboxypeptidase